MAQAEHSVKLSGVSRGTNAAEIRRFFEEMGYTAITDVYLPPAKEFGFVRFSSEEEALAAAAMQVISVGGVELALEMSTSKKRKWQGGSSGGDGWNGWSGGGGGWNNQMGNMMQMMGGKGGGGPQAMMGMMMAMMQGCDGGGWGGNWTGGDGGAQKGQKAGQPGSGRVFVRGFDFGTSNEQLIGHMSAVGEVADVQWDTKGSATVVFTEKASANRAAQELNQSIISGNTRYIDVILKDSE